MADSAEVTFVMETGAVGTQVLIVIPGQVPGLSRSHAATFAPYACHAHPGHAAVHRLRVCWSQTRRVERGLASSALQHRLRALASTPTHMTELAAPAAPVLLVLLLGALLGREAETVERLAADLAENHLVSAFTGAQQTDGLRSGRDRSEDAEASH